MDGILNIDKPYGKTSYSVVATVKRLSGERRVGHAGTLDPMATGVLPVCLGRGTRVIEFFADATKVYRAQIELGAATDTYDASGRITQKGDISDIDRERLESAFNLFRGSIQQTPPMFSAVKYHGQPLYKLARSGIKVERRSRLAKIYSLEILGWQPPVVTIEVACGKGTYIRSLANDLGEHLGCGGHLNGLIRLKYGSFDVKDAISISQIEEAFSCGYWQRLLYPIDFVLQHMRAMIVGKETEGAIRNGVAIDLTGGAADKESGSAPQQLSASPSGENYCRAYTLEGQFLGILRLNVEEGQWQPEKVFL